jgi:ATP-binding cassette, subfamily B, bacterial
MRRAATKSEQMDRTQRGKRRGWGLLLHTTLQAKWAMVIGISAGLVWTIGRVAIPNFTQRAIDGGVVGGRTSALVGWSIAIIVAGILSAACSGLRRYLAFRVAYSVETELREGMFSNLCRLDFRFHDRSQTGQLMARSATDLQQINGLVTMIPISVANAVTVTVVAIVLFLINWQLALIALGCLPFVSVAAKRFSTRLHPVSMSVQQELSNLSTVVEESVTGVRAIKGLGAEGGQSGQMSVQAGTVYDLIMRLARIRGLFTPCLDVLPIVGLAGVLWYGGLQVLHHRLSVGDLVEFNLYLAMLVGPLQMLGQIIAQAQRALASSERVAEILDATPVVAQPHHPVHLPAGNGEVQFDDVVFAYGEKVHPVLDRFNLTIAGGESIALVGSTGSGKTTVARLVPRFYDPDIGAVRLDGVDVRKIDLVELRRSIAVVFEDTFLFSDSVGDNIAFGQPDASIEEVLRAARLAGADEFVNELPEGYDTLLGERGLSLSGGQRQRIALARAILADPRVLILDDATSSVDASKEHEIRDAMATVMEGRTTIVISHRPVTIALANRVVLLDQGRVVAEGTHEGLLETCPRYQEVLAQGAAIDAARAELRAEEVGS